MGTRDCGKHSSRLLVQMIVESRVASLLSAVVSFFRCSILLFSVHLKLWCLRNESLDQREQELKNMWIDLKMVNLLFENVSRWICETFLSHPHISSSSPQQYDCWCAVFQHIPTFNEVNLHLDTIILSIRSLRRIEVSVFDCPLINHCKYQQFLHICLSLQAYIYAFYIW